MSTSKKIHIGVLDIQGSVEEHLAMLKKLEVKTLAVKTKEDIAKIDGLIIPGGESTTIGKLIHRYGLDDAIREKASSNSPLVVWGTCAGAILLAKKIKNKPPLSLKLMDIEVERNAYGRQLDSFETEIRVPRLGAKKFPAIFIRAPQAQKASAEVKVLAKYKGRAVMLQQKNMLVTTFHPELTTDTRVHKYFISLVKHYAKTRKSS